MKARDLLKRAQSIAAKRDGGPGVASRIRIETVAPDGTVTGRYRLPRPGEDAANWVEVPRDE